MEWIPNKEAIDWEMLSRERIPMIKGYIQKFVKWNREKQTKLNAWENK